MRTILTNQEYENISMSSRICSKWDTAAERLRERGREREKEQSACLTPIRYGFKVKSEPIMLLYWFQVCS